MNKDRVIRAGKNVADVTVIILTLNEELHLARALACISWAARIVVIDSGSTDATVTIAKSLGADVLIHAFRSHADQLNWALDNANITTEWVMRLDADEIIGADLANNIKSAIKTLQTDITCINFARRHIFMGRWIKYGGRYPLIMLRLWRHGCAQVESRWMDEHMIPVCGESIMLEGAFCDANLNDVGWFTAKHSGYAVREAVDVLSAKYALDTAPDSLLNKQAQRKRRFKAHIYNKLPFGIGPLGYFIWRMTVQLGFLDGREGLVYHVLQGFWYRFLVDVRKLEFERALADCKNNEQKLAILSKLSGIALEKGGAIQS